MTVEEPSAPSLRRESARRTAILGGLAALAVLTGVLVAIALQRGETETSTVPPPTLATPTVGDASESEPTPEPEPEPEPTPTPEPEPTPTPEPTPVARSLGVMVLNATNITGLAARTTGTVSSAGWTVLGSGNAQGTYPADTIYYPPGGYEQAQLLAADLGIGRLMPNLAGMPSNRLTVVLASAR